MQRQVENQIQVHIETQIGTCRDSIADTNRDIVTGTYIDTDMGPD